MTLELATVRLEEVGEDLGREGGREGGRAYLGPEHGILLVVLSDDVEGKGEEALLVGAEGVGGQQTFEHVDDSVPVKVGRKGGREGGNGGWVI